jgi:hypothetical protein
MIVDEKFIRSLVGKYGKHVVFTDGGTWEDEACNIIRLKQYLHLPFRKILMERVNQYFNDRIESFDDYYRIYKRNVICYIDITGYISLSLCIMI